MTWVYMDIEEVLEYLRGELVGMSPSSCELTMSPWELFHILQRTYGGGRGTPFLG